MAEKKNILINGINIDDWIEDDKVSVTDEIKTTLTYEKKLVAFLDLLGITEEVRKKVNGLEEEIISKMEKIKDIVDKEVKSINNGKIDMLNPEIIKKDGVYDTEEGCLSLLGDPRPCKRYKSIKVKYQTLELQTRIKTYTGWTAQIIQHEIEHCEGVLI